MQPLYHAIEVIDEQIKVLDRGFERTAKRIRTWMSCRSLTAWEH